MSNTYKTGWDNMKHITREAWLQAAIAQATPTFEQHGYIVPDVRVSCGWPVRGGLGKKRRVLGECWTADASADKLSAQIFVSPAISGIFEPFGVLATLVHELVHAVVGHKNLHNKIFGKCARAVGLEGKLTQTNASDALIAQFAVWSVSLGEYPHSQLDGLSTDKRKQSTRLRKCECPECGYAVRVTQKWLDIGAPLCPTDDILLEAEIKETDEN